MGKRGSRLGIMVLSGGGGTVRGPSMVFSQFQFFTKDAGEFMRMNELGFLVVVVSKRV